MVENRIHTMASHHGYNTANHGQTWLAVKNLGTMVNLIPGYLLLKDLIALKDIDVFTLSESWLNENVLDCEIQIPGFNIYRRNRSHKLGGRVCVHVKEQF